MCCVVTAACSIKLLFICAAYIGITINMVTLRGYSLLRWGGDGGGGGAGAGRSGAVDVLAIDHTRQPLAITAWLSSIPL